MFLWVHENLFSKSAMFFWSKMNREFWWKQLLDRIALIEHFAWLFPLIDKKAESRGQRPCYIRVWVCWRARFHIHLHCPDLDLLTTFFIVGKSVLKTFWHSQLHFLSSFQEEINPVGANTSRTTTCCLIRE